MADITLYRRRLLRNIVAYVWLYALTMDTCLAPEHTVLVLIMQVFPAG